MYYNSAHAATATKLCWTMLGPAAIMDPQADYYNGPSAPPKAKSLRLPLRMKDAQAQLIQSLMQGSDYPGCHLQRIFLN